MKPAIIVADTNPLLSLTIMELLPFLPSLFERMYVPATVVRECLSDLSKPQATTIQKALAESYLTERAATNQNLCGLLAEVLDAGEAEAITLAQELQAAVLMDERKGREVAKREGIPCVGSLYCLIRARQTGLIDAAAPRLERLQRHGYYLHEKLIATVLERCGEA